MKAEPLLLLRRLVTGRRKAPNGKGETTKVGNVRLSGRLKEHPGEGEERHKNAWDAWDCAHEWNLVSLCTGLQASKFWGRYQEIPGDRGREQAGETQG